MQRTLVLLKPDAVQRALAGEIIARIERKGLKIAGMKLMLIGEALAREHYGEHVGKPFFEGLVEYITSSPVVAMAVEGENAVEVVRRLLGATNPQDADPGTIRGDYGMSIGLNLTHGSDSEESAARELALFFSSEELLCYDRATEPWITES